MYEILFHGKMLDTGEWVEGFYHYRDYVFNDETVRKHYILPINAQDAVEVTPNTVGRSTGLTDKNGKKIFEGDILSTENGTFSNTGMGYILLYRGMWTSFYGQDALGRDCFDELYTVCSEREVIGNIHDNPELLEGGVSDGV